MFGSIGKFSYILGLPKVSVMGSINCGQIMMSMVHQMALLQVLRLHRNKLQNGIMLVGDSSITIQ
jgi:hypothetical protein